LILAQQRENSRFANDADRFPASHRNLLRNPGQQNWNAGLLNRFPTFEGQDLIYAVWNQS
jgi:hypothetical protein